MKNNKFRKGMSAVLAFVMCLSTFLTTGSITAFAAGEKAEAYIVSFPREGDAHYDEEWGHGNLNFMNGWKGHETKRTNAYAVNSYSGKVCYCIEPGRPLEVGDALTARDESYWDNYPSAYNKTISSDEIKLFIGRILQYGYQGNISTAWRSQNEDDANKIAHITATQILIWETVVGERDEYFNKVSTGKCDEILSAISSKHPLRSKIMSYYNSMESSVKNHTKTPSFFAKTAGKAQTVELEWDGSKYTATMTDKNKVLGNYKFSSNHSDMKFKVDGNKLVITTATAPDSTITIKAEKKDSQRKGVIVWDDGTYAPDSGKQNLTTYAQSVNDPVKGYLKVKVSYGSCQIIKSSEDGVVDGIKFTLSGNGINKTVTTANGGKIQVDNLMPGVYTVTEQNYDRYEPQEVRRVTVVAGQTAKVTFSNVLKRGDLKVVKSSEDNLVEGVTFHLYGTSLSGLAVDEYAVTDKNGVAKFSDVLISGSTPYTIEEVDTAIRYVVPENQTAPIKWNEVTNRSFTNVLKKFNVTVTKSDAEEGTAQGNAKLSGAVYGIYK